jgi:hypothetical protein
VCPRPTARTAAREIADRRTCPMTGVIGSEYRLSTLRVSKQHPADTADLYAGRDDMQEETIQFEHGGRSQTSPSTSDRQHTTCDDPREPMSNDPRHRPSMLRIRLPQISKLSPPGKVVSINRAQNGTARRQVQ